MNLSSFVWRRNEFSVYSIQFSGERRGTLHCVNIDKMQSYKRFEQYVFPKDEMIYVVTHTDLRKAPIIYRHIPVSHRYGDYYFLTL